MKRWLPVGIVVAILASLSPLYGMGQARAANVPGTVTLNAGTLGFVNLFPSGLNWTATLNGNNQYVATVGAGNNPPDGQIVVDDATGSGAGWNVNVAMTQFSTGGTTPVTMPNSNVYVNGHQASTTNSQSLAALPAGSVPPYACASNSTCTLPNSSLTAANYPVNILSNGTTPGTAAKVANAQANSGMGTVNIPLDWWVFIPANQLLGSGTFNNTFTINVASGP